jgi:hypothetical protein
MPSAAPRGVLWKRRGAEEAAATSSPPVEAPSSEGADFWRMPMPQLDASNGAGSFEGASPPGPPRREAREPRAALGGGGSGAAVTDRDPGSYGGYGDVAGVRIAGYARRVGGAPRRQLGRRRGTMDNAEAAGPLRGSD